MLEAKNAQLQVDLKIEKNNCNILRKEYSKYDEKVKIWNEDIDHKKVEAKHSKLHDSSDLDAKHDRLSTEGLYSPMSDNRKEFPLEWGAISSSVLNSCHSSSGNTGLLGLI